LGGGRFLERPEKNSGAFEGGGRVNGGREEGKENGMVA